MIKKEENREKKVKKSRVKIGCPVCGETENLVPNGRCVTCLNCGWSKCNI